jgi:hypothetical protein
VKALAQRAAASVRLAQVSRQVPEDVRHGLKDRFPVSGMRVVPALRVGRRRIVRRGVKGPVARRAVSRAAAIMLRVGMMVSVRRASLKAVVTVANARRAVLTVNVAKVLRADLRVTTVLRVVTIVSVRPVGLKVAAIAVNALRVALTVNVARVLRAGLRAAAIVRRVVTLVSVHLASLKVAAIAASALRVALTVNAAKVLRAGLKAAAIVLRVVTLVSVRLASLKVVVIAVNALRAGSKVPPIAASERPAALKAAPIAANVHPAVSMATAPRDVTKANAARSAVRVRVQAARRKAAHVANVQRGMHQIAHASAATVAPLRNAAVASVGRAATAHRAALKASAGRPSVASAPSRSLSKAATATARIARRGHRVTTAANGHQPNVSSAIVRRVPANVTNVATGANALLAASTRRCRLPAAALATTTAPPVPTSRVPRRPQPEPNATMMQMPRRAHRAAITKMHRAPCACPS